MTDLLEKTISDYEKIMRQNSELKKEIEKTFKKRKIPIMPGKERLLSFDLFLTFLKFVGLYIPELYPRVSSFYNGGNDPLFRVFPGSSDGVWNFSTAPNLAAKLDKTEEKEYFFRCLIQDEPDDKYIKLIRLWIEGEKIKNNFFSKTNCNLFEEIDRLILRKRNQDNGFSSGAISNKAYINSIYIFKDNPFWLLGSSEKEKKDISLEIQTLEDLVDVTEKKFIEHMKCMVVASRYEKEDNPYENLLS